jgi:hypothetical protein
MAPQLTPDQIAQVSVPVSQYISTQREKYATRAIPLSAQQKAAMNGWVLAASSGWYATPRAARRACCQPDFYPMLRSLGFNNLPDQSTMAAITFCDVVVSHEAFSDGLLFHELVHVEQYRQLGIPRFSELYVRGFLDGGSYEAIPLEVNAYTLGGRFESNRNPLLLSQLQQSINHVQLLDIEGTHRAGGNFRPVETGLSQSHSSAGNAR